MNLVRLRSRREWNRHLLRLVAYHESGHAVAAYELRFRFQKVDIIPDWNRLGCIRGVRQPSRVRPDPAAVEDYVVCLLAGAAAVQVHCPYHRSGALPERVRARFWAERAHTDPDQRDALLRRAEERARELVTRYGPAIEGLVEVLLEKREVDSAEARRIIVRSMRRSGEASLGAPGGAAR